MKDNSYLYGDDVDVPEIDSYVVARRIELLNDNLAELLEEHWLKRDAKRINDIQRAIKFWEMINNK